MSENVDEATIEWENKIKAATSEHGLRGMGLEPLRVLSAACIAELERRRTIEAAPGVIAEQAEALEKATAGDKPRKLADIPTGETIPPKGRFVDAEGVEWVNESLLGLSPHTAGPDKYPWGWKRAQALPTDGVKAWVAGEKMVKDELRSFEGKVWRCLQDHTSQSYFKPGQASALWVEA